MLTALDRLWAFALTWDAVPLLATYEGRHRSPEGARSTRKADRELHNRVHETTVGHHVFGELAADPGLVGEAYLDTPPVPLRRYRALRPRALVAATIQATRGVRGEWNRAVRRDRVLRPAPEDHVSEPGRSTPEIKDDDRGPALPV